MGVAAGAPAQSPARLLAWPPTRAETCTLLPAAMKFFYCFFHDEFLRGCVLLRRFPLAANHSRRARPPAAAFSQAEALESRTMGMHLRIRQRQEAV